MIKIIVPFFKLIRVRNLILIAIMQLTIHFGFLKHQNINLALTDLNFLVLVFATVLIAAAGYVINDIFDQETDQINKPNRIIVNQFISEKDAYMIYFICNISGVFAGFYLSNVIGKPSFASLFIVIASSLYFYATTLKQSFLVGNFLVAFLSFLSVLIVAVFDLYPTIDESNKSLIAVFFKIILDYAIFAFVINFIREIVKDAQDVEGDNEQQMSTLPIVLGVFWTKIIVATIGSIFALAIIWYVNFYFFQNHLYVATIFAIVFVISPFFVFLFKIIPASTQNDFKLLSILLKVVMFFGIITLIVSTLNIQNHA